MTGTPRRVSVTAPRTARPAPDPAYLPEIQDAALDEVDEVSMRTLMRNQLRLGLTTCLSVCGALAVLPLLFALRPGTGALLAWLVLGVLVYPVLVVVGWVYIRLAERNERAFADLVRR